MVAERGPVFWLKEEERRTCCPGSRKTVRFTISGECQERGSRHSMGSGLGFRLASATDQSWDVGRSLSLSHLSFLFCRTGRTAVCLPRGCYKM